MTTERIAFAACSKFSFDADQAVWDEIAAQGPQHLFLLGDQIYMDYQGDSKLTGRWPGFVGYENGQTRNIALPEFEQQMRLRYQQQFSVPSFRSLVRGIGAAGGTVAMVWDDHDFGFNNALGSAGGPQDNDATYERHIIDADRKRVSRRLFEEFRRSVQALAANPAATFHAPLDAGWAPADMGGVGGHHTLRRENVLKADVFLVDTRTWRQSPARRGQPGSRILGQEQWNWLATGLRDSNAPLVIIASGSPLTSSGFLSDQSWKQARDKNAPYREHDDLLRLVASLKDAKRVLFIGGDRHTAKFIGKPSWLPEVVCAGAAAPKPFGRAGRHFCIVAIEDDGRSGVRLFTRGQLDETHALFGGAPPPTAAAIATVATAATLQGLATTLAAPAAAPQPPTLEAGASQLWRAFSTRFLVTNRRIVGDTVTDDVTDALTYHYYDGDQLQVHAHRLKNWKQVDAAEFWDGLLQTLEKLAVRNPNPPQLCLFVHGNRKNNEAVIAQYAALDSICFNAQGGGCLGACVAFDWATRADNGILALLDVYRENIARVPAAAALFRQVLRDAGGVAGLAGVPLSIFAHSLGNRVAVQALAGIVPAPTEPVVQHYLANAADLGQDVFQTAEGQAVLAACRHITVPFTHRDNTLRLAAQHVLQPGPRLGREGPAGANVPGNVCFKDVSLVCHLQEAHSGLLLGRWAPPWDHAPLQSGFANAMAQYFWA